MRKVQLETTETLAQRHLGIIIKVALFHWRQLPPYATFFIGVDDMISELVLAVSMVGACYRKRRGAESTFVWRVASNRARVVVNTYARVRKRQAGFRLPEEELRKHISRDRTRGFLESKHDIECWLQGASDDLQQYFSDFLEHRRYREAPSHLLEEARLLAWQHHVTYNDFRLVLRCI